MINAVKYISVLQSRALPQLCEWYSENNREIFMLDGDSCHTANVVKKFLADQNVKVLDWPGNQPDLNLWKIFGLR